MKIIVVIPALAFFCAVTFGNNIRAEGTGEIVVNGDFEAGGEGNPFIPAGWHNADGDYAFRAGELALHTRAPLGGEASLEINTLGGGAGVSRRLYVPLALDASATHGVSFRGQHLDGGGYVTVSVRNKPEGSAVSFIQAVGDVGIRGAIRRSGTHNSLHLFDISHPYLVIQARGAVNVLLDDISIRPSDRRAGTGFGHQFFQVWQRDWQRGIVSGEVETPHTKWAKPYAGGGIRVISILPRWWHRWTVELTQRVSMLECWTVMFAGHDDLGRDYWVKGADGEPEVFRVRERALEQLSAPADCIVINILHESHIDEAGLAERLLARVREGVGLVIVGYQRDTDENSRGGVWREALSSDNRLEGIFLFVGGPGAYLSSGVSETTHEEFYRYGEGRIALLRTRRTLVPDAQQKLGRTRVRRGSTVIHTRADIEAELAYVIKAMLWAADKMPPIYMNRFVLPGGREVPFRGDIGIGELPASARVGLSAPLAEPAVLSWWFDDYSGRGMPGGEVRLAAGAEAADVEVPRLSGGRHWLNLQLKKADGSVYDWNTAVLDVSTGAVIKDIKLDRQIPPYYIEGDVITGSVLLSGKLREDYSLLLKLTDADGHVWREKTTDNIGTGGVKFALATERAPVMMHYIEAELFGPDGMLDSRSRTVTVIRPQEWYNSRYDFSLWDVPPYRLASLYPYLAGLISAELRKHGVTSSYRGTDWVNVWHNMRSVRATPNVPSDAELLGDVVHAPERSPCLNDPAKRETLQPVRADYAPLAYELGHERNLLGPGRIEGREDADICFSEHCLASFRVFLRDEYGTLEALNSGWGTGFGDWEEVRPVVLADAVKEGQLSRWVDHRRHMDRVFTGFWRHKFDVIRENDPGAQAVFDNVRSPTSYSGVDYWLLLGTLAAASGAPHLREFVPSELRYLTWARYGYWHLWRLSPDDDLFRRRIEREIWGRGLMGGVGGSSYWSMLGRAPPDRSWFRQPLAPDLRTTEDARWSIDPVEQIRTGIDRLVFEGSYNDSGIGVLYSRSSEHAAVAWQALQGEPAKRLFPSLAVMEILNSFTRALGGMSYRHSVVSEAQVAGGILEKGNFRMLILPFTQAIDAAAAEAIKDFVARGGAVLADIRPAVADRHGNPAERGLLDDVFGVAHDTGWENYTPEEAEAVFNGNPVKLTLGPPLRIVTAESPLEKVAGRPIMLENRYGEGRALLFNCRLPHSDILEQTLAAFGLEPLFTVEALTESRPYHNRPVRPAGEEAVKEIEVDDPEVYMVEAPQEAARPGLSHFMNGNIHVFALTYWSRRGAGTQVLRITPPEEGHIYDLKTNEYLGRHAVFEAELPLEGGGVYASVPYRIERPSMRVQSGETDAGNPTMECAVRLSPLEAAGEKHVVRLRLFDPEGVEWKDFAENIVVENGEGGYLFVLPLNAPSGTWSLEAREAISGLSDKVSIRLDYDRRVHVLATAMMDLLSGRVDEAGLMGYEKF